MEAADGTAPENTTAADNAGVEMAQHWRMQWKIWRINVEYGSSSALEA